jgi:hypothetical protein
MSTTIQWKPVQQYIEGLNALDADMALSGFSPDAEVRYPGQEPMNVAAWNAYLTEVFGQFESFKFIPNQVFETGHGTAALWTLTATTKKGRTATCDGMDYWRKGRDGAVDFLAVVYDPSPLLEALQG